jgi:hypothetical protein
MSDSLSIQNQFQMAVRYQANSTNTITVLLLDEVGLAEHSPDMPLKCLHGMLVDPPISIVGLSNWVLDSAKMNRAILVQRPEPTKEDITTTGSSIVGLQSKVQSKTIDQILEKVSRTYFEVYTNQIGRGFIGMRDYYSLVKNLRKYRNDEEIPKRDLVFSICRNFGGRDDILCKTLRLFCDEVYESEAEDSKNEQNVKQNNKIGNENNESNYDSEIFPYIKESFDFPFPLISDLISTNLKENDSRNLMLLTKNCSALWILFSGKFVDIKQTKVIIGSQFPEDNNELYMVQQMNEVKLAMATGKIIVLMNADNMYEALYDVLNQRYLTKKNQNTGEIQRFLRLAIGSRSSLCYVEGKKHYLRHQHHLRNFHHFHH